MLSMCFWETVYGVMCINKVRTLVIIFAYKTMEISNQNCHIGCVICYLACCSVYFLICLAKSEYRIVGTHVTERIQNAAGADHIVLWMYPKG